MQSLAHTLLDPSYNFTMTLLIHMDADISIILCRGFLEKSIIYLLYYKLGHIVLTCIGIGFWGGKIWFLPLWT